MCIVVKFDEECKTENNYDFVKFFKDASKTEVWHPEVEKFSGRGGNENFPGQGGRPPLVIEGSQAIIEVLTTMSKKLGNSVCVNCC